MGRVPRNAYTRSPERLLLPDDEALVGKIERLEDDNERLRDFALWLLERHPEERLWYAFYGDEAEQAAVRRRGVPHGSPKFSRDESKAVVYYIDRGATVKIGTTVNITARMQAIQALPFDLLAVEAGGFDVESRRHLQFAALRIGRTELFRKDETLMAHVAATAEANPGPMRFACLVNDIRNPQAA